MTLKTLGSTGGSAQNFYWPELFYPQDLYFDPKNLRISQWLCPRFLFAKNILTSPRHFWTWGLLGDCWRLCPRFYWVELSLPLKPALWPQNNYAPLEALLQNFWADFFWSFYRPFWPQETWRSAGGCAQIIIGKSYLDLKWHYETKNLRFRQRLCPNFYWAELSLPI